MKRYLLLVVAPCSARYALHERRILLWPHAQAMNYGINMLPESFSISYSHYLQCSQQNTNSLHFFATSTLCFHHFMNSFRKKHPG